ncbi:hypothetical protein Pcinc_043718 [Petrolisthes cinctipes]|uniref:Uncharacterized protein n=1 Tax=Petrolisthes cinctipes TaxID=88211 RepID=A0AAE1BG46_PETCI|nr:hypothetical protein Pcinc_043718 [Petrolisthes cinctipes]
MTVTGPSLVVVVVVCVTAVVGQQETNFNTTWIQDVRPGYKIDLAHYYETQVDRISKCKALCFTLPPCMSWYTLMGNFDSKMMLRSISSSFTCRLLNHRPNATHLTPDFAAVSSYGILASTVSHPSVSLTSHCCLSKTSGYNSITFRYSEQTSAALINCYSVHPLLLLYQESHFTFDLMRDTCSGRYTEHLTILIFTQGRR